jgi:ABC-type multidrug transport system fused ATPase/permease subunit
MRGYWRESILGPLFKLLEAVFELFVPLVVAAVIDRGIRGGDRRYVLLMCLVLVALGVVGLLSSVTAQYFAAKAAAGFAKKVKSILFGHVQSLSFSEIDTLGTSTIITRLTNDMNQIQNGVNLFLRLVMRSPFVVFGAMVMAFTIDARAAVIFVVVIPILSVVVFSVMLTCIPLYKKIQGRLDKVLGLIKENLSGVRVIRAFRMEANETGEFDRRNEALTRMQKRAGRFSALMNPATFIVINIAIICLIRSGALRVDAGALSQGQVVALYNLMSQILVELIKMATLIITMTKAVACGNRVQDVLELRSSQIWPDVSPEEAIGDLAVEFRGVSLRYQNAGGNALSGIDFAAKKGQTIGVIGGTGSGKSSLVHMIPRFYDAYGGEVLVNGVNVKDYPQKELRAKVGIVPQKAVLFGGTLRENMRWGDPNATDEEIYEALTTAQAKEVADAKGGLDFVIGQGGKNLSGGQRQRFTIARALVKKPEILILDDSSSALDFATDAALRRAVKAMGGRTTVFVVSQRASSVQYADRIIVLDDGEIAGIGTAEELLQTCEVYKEIHESQFKKEGAASDAGQKKAEKN